MPISPSENIPGNVFGVGSVLPELLPAGGPCVLSVSAANPTADLRWGLAVELAQLKDVEPEPHDGVTDVRVNGCVFEILDVFGLRC